MITAYECGAKYLVLFNYYFEDSGPYGMLTEEHFEAMETFWNNVVKNHRVVHALSKQIRFWFCPKTMGGA
jgi:hypothetical protein